MVTGDDLFDEAPKSTRETLAGPAIRKGSSVVLTLVREELRGQRGVVLSREGIEYAVRLKSGRTVHVNDTQLEET